MLCVKALDFRSRCHSSHSTSKLSFWLSWPSSSSSHLPELSDFLKTRVEEQVQSRLDKDECPQKHCGFRTCWMVQGVQLDKSILRILNENSRSACRGDSGVKRVFCRFFCCQKF